MNYFQGNAGHPRHLSVGAVMANDEGLVRAHYYPEDMPVGFWKDRGVRDFYILMRETVNPNEPLEAALARGLAEEFNAKARIEDYLGAIVSTAYDDRDGGHVPFQKATLYFLCQYEGEVGARRDLSDKEGNSTLVWKRPEELIELMRGQSERFGRGDLDESSILALL